MPSLSNKTNQIVNIAYLAAIFTAGTLGYRQHSANQREARATAALKEDTTFASRALGIRINGTAETKEIAGLARELPQALGKLLHRLGDHDPVIRERLRHPIQLRIIRDSKWQHSRSHDCVGTSDGGFAIRLGAIREFTDRQRYPFLADYDQQQAADVFAAKMLPIVAGITVQRHMIQRLRAVGSSDRFVASAEALGIVGTHEYAAALIAYDSLPLDLRLSEPDLQRGSRGLLGPWVPDSLSWIAGYQPRSRWHAPSDLAQLASSLCAVPEAPTLTKLSRSSETTNQVPNILAAMRILERCGFSSHVSRLSENSAQLDKDLLPQASDCALNALQQAQSATLQPRLHDLGIARFGGKLLLPNAVVSFEARRPLQSPSTELTRALVSIAGHLEPGSAGADLVKLLDHSVSLCDVECRSFAKRPQEAAFLASLSDDRFSGLELGYTICDLHRLAALLPQELQAAAQSRLSGAYRALCASIMPTLVKELKVLPSSRSLRVIHSELIAIGSSCGYISAAETKQLHGTLAPLAIEHLPPSFPTPLLLAIPDLSAEEQFKFLEAACTAESVPIDHLVPTLSDDTKRALLRWVASQRYCSNEATLSGPFNTDKFAASPWDQIEQILEFTSELPEPARDYIRRALASLPPSERFWSGYQDLLNPGHLTIQTAPLRVALSALHNADPRCPTPQEILRSGILPPSPTSWPESTTIMAATDAQSLAWGTTFSESIIRHLQHDRPLVDAFARARADIERHEVLILDESDSDVHPLAAGRYFMFPQARRGANSQASTPDAALIIVGGTTDDDTPLRFNHEAEMWRSALSITYNCPSSVISISSQRELRDSMVDLYTRAPGGTLAVIFLCHGIQAPIDTSRHAHATAEGSLYSGKFLMSKGFYLTEQGLKSILSELPGDASYELIFNSCHSGSVVE